MNKTEKKFCEILVAFRHGSERFGVQQLFPTINDLPSALEGITDMTRGMI